MTGYYAPTSRFGHPDDFRYLIDRLHRAGIGVIMDWVPGALPERRVGARALRRRAALRALRPAASASTPTGAPYVFNFGDSQVRNFLVANALYWLEEFHIDGLRVDAVASMLYLDYSREDGEWVPNVHGGRENLEAISFLQEANATAYKRNPGIVMIAEESTSWPGVTRADRGRRARLRPQVEHGLDARLAAVHARRTRCGGRDHHNDITFSFLYAFSENFLLPISHDEVVHGKGSLLHKMPGDQWQKLANVRAYLAVHVGAPRQAAAVHGLGVRAALGVERSSAASTGGSSTSRRTRGCSGSSARSTGSTRASPALWELDNDASGFEWIDGRIRRANVVAFLRRARDGSTARVRRELRRQPGGAVPRSGCRVAGRWDEVLNTDAAEYGGSGVGNLGGVDRDRPSRGTASRPRSSSRCRRSRRSGCARRASRCACCPARAAGCGRGSTRAARSAGRRSAGR